MPNSCLASKLPVVVPKRDRTDQEVEGQGTTFYKLPSDFHFKPTFIYCQQKFTIFLEKIGSYVAHCINSSMIIYKNPNTKVVDKNSVYLGVRFWVMFGQNCIQKKAVNRIPERITE